VTARECPRQESNLRPFA